MRSVTILTCLYLAVATAAFGTSLTSEDVTCPLDGHEFSIEVPMSGTLGGLSPLLQPFFLGESHLSYRVVTCPRCSYSTWAHEFEDPVENPEAVHEALKGHVQQYHSAAAIPLVDSYSLALRCAAARKLGLAHRADLLLEASWIAEPAGRSDLLEQWRREARDSFLALLANPELLNEKGGSPWWDEELDRTVRAHYLVGALSLEIGDRELALKHFGYLEKKREELPEPFRSLLDQQIRLLRGQTAVEQVEFGALPPKEQLEYLRSMGDRGVLETDLDTLRLAVTSKAGAVADLARSLSFHIPDARFVEIYMEGLGDDRFEVVRDSAFALGRLREGAATKALITALVDAKPYARFAIVWALNEIDSPESVRAAVASVRSFEPGDFDEYSIARILAHNPDPAWIPVVLDLLATKEPSGFQYSFSVLNQFLKQWPDGIDALSERFAAAQGDEKISLALGLAELGDPTGFKVLLAHYHDQAAREYRNVYQRDMVLEPFLRAFGLIEQPETIPFILQACGSSNGPARASAIRALARFARSEDRGVFEAALEHEYSLVRGAGIEGLTALPDTEQQLNAMVEDDDQTVSWMALTGLATRGSAASRDLLLQVLKRQEPDLRAMAVHALAIKEIPDLEQHLEPLVKDRSEIVQLALVSTLKQRSTDQARVLLERLSRSPWEQVREAIENTEPQE